MKSKVDLVFCSECVAWSPDGERGRCSLGRCHIGPPCDDSKWPHTAHDDYCFSGIKGYGALGKELRADTNTTPLED